MHFVGPVFEIVILERFKVSPSGLGSGNLILDKLRVSSAVVIVGRSEMGTFGTFPASGAGLSPAEGSAGLSTSGAGLFSPAAGSAGLSPSEADFSPPAAGSAGLSPSAAGAGSAGLSPPVTGFLSS